MAHWTFLSNHAHVLLLLWGEPDLRVRELAERIGITSRAVQRITHDLVEGGYLEVTRDGRRNRYTVRDELPLRHPVESGATVACLLEILRSSRQPHGPDDADDPAADSAAPGGTGG